LRLNIVVMLIGSIKKPSVLEKKLKSCLLPRKSHLNKVPKNNKLPQEIIDHWPEIFEDVEIKAIPIEYLQGVNVHFKDGRQWNIDLRRRRGTTLEAVEEILDEFFKEHDELIESVDFNLNTQKVKKDVQERTKRFMKRPK